MFREAKNADCVNYGMFFYSPQLIHLLFSYLLTYKLIYLFTPGSTVLLEKPTVSQLVKKFPALYIT